jgi:ABC-type uncharacterized transport system involved in gliding motility auxiliary subunit
MPRCSVIWAIYKRNLASYFAGVLGFLFVLAFVVFDSLLTFTDQFFANNLATLDELTSGFPLLLLFFVPAITMGVWAEERKQGTDELLFTLPTTDVEILLGKYLAAVSVYTIALGFAATKVAVLAYYADPDLRLMATTFLGYWLSGVSLIAVGMFASAIIPNTTAAFVLGVVVCAVPVFVDQIPYVDRIAAGGRLVESLSMPHHLRDFGVGLVPLSGLLYFLSLTLFGLYLNLVLITRRHWSADRATDMRVQYLVRIACLVVVLVCLNYAVRRTSDVAPLQLDATAEQLHTLSDETRTVLRSIPEDDPVEVRAFVSPDLPQDHVDQGRALERLLGQYARLGGNRIDVTTVSAAPHTDEADEAESFGITPQTVQHEDATGQRSDEVFLGAVVTGPRGEVKVPYLSPTASVEYEMTRAIASVTQRQKATVGLVNTPVAQQMNDARRGKVRFVELLERHYDVETIFPDGEFPLDREIAFELWTPDDEAKAKAARERQKAQEAADAKPSDAKPADDAADPELKPEPENGDAPADDEREPADDPQDDEAADPADESPDDDVEPDNASDDADVKPETEEPPREKPERRSQYLEEDPAQDFDAKQIPDEFRKRLEWRGVPLSTEATVTVRRPGSLWTITDVNPDKTYTVQRDEAQREVKVTSPRFDVVIAVMPSGLTSDEMGHLVDYVETGRPVLIFDDPLPLHIGGFLALDPSPVRPREPEQPQSPGMPPQPGPEKADGGRATSLTRALGIVWEYDEVVWDEFDPHPNHQELPTGNPNIHVPLLYVSRDNGTSNAFSQESPVTAGLHELQFIHPGRINPLSNSPYRFEPLVRVGAESGWSRWSDLIETGRPQPNPFMPAPPTETVIRGMLGDATKRLDLTVGFLGVENPNGGVRVTAVTADGPAAKAGLETGDVVTHVGDGRNLDRVRSMDDVEDVVSLLPIDREATLQVERNVNGATRDLDLKITPTRTARFCLAGRITAPRRITVEIVLPAGRTDEAAQSIAEKLAQPLGELEGVEEVTSKVEERAGRSYSVTTVEVAPSVPDRLPTPAEDNPPAADAEGAKPKSADAPLDFESLTAKVKSVVDGLEDLPQGAAPKVEHATGRNAIFVADIDMLGIIPLVLYSENPEEDVDFKVDNATFVLNAVDVLAGREALVALRGRRARHRIISEVERQVRKLDAVTNTAIRAARKAEKEELAEYERKRTEQERKLQEARDLEDLQEAGMSVLSARSRAASKIADIQEKTERKVDRLRAENRRKVVSLQHRIRFNAILFSILPVIVLGLVLLVAQLVAERSQFDPARSRRT